MRKQRLDRLESLVREAARRIKDLSGRNARLRAEVGQLMEENGRLELQFRRFKSLSQRQEQIRTRLERAARKLDKVLDIAE
ncbi:MAG: cell division protein ZapB [Elusimicrobiota bacterium]